MPIHVQSLGGDYIALLSLFPVFSSSPPPRSTGTETRSIVPSNHMSHYHYYYDDQLTSMIMSSHSMEVMSASVPCVHLLSVMSHILSLELKAIRLKSLITGAQGGIGVRRRRRRRRADEKEPTLCSAIFTMLPQTFQKCIKLSRLLPSGI